MYWSDKNSSRRLGIGAVVVALLCGLMLTAVPAGATVRSSLPTDYPVCMEITQPTITGAELSADGALFRWTWATPPTNGSKYSVRRYVDGAWVTSVSWGDLGGIDALFVPWTENGVRATALILNVVVACYGNIPVNGYLVEYSDYLDQQAAANAAAAQAEAAAAQAAAAQAQAAAAAAAAQVSQPSSDVSGYRSCRAMTKDYPNGISVSSAAAARAVRHGDARPSVRPKVFAASSTRLDRDKDGSMCERPRGT